MGNECPFSVLSSWDRKEGRKREGGASIRREREQDGRGRAGGRTRTDVVRAIARRAGIAADCDNVAENKLGPAVRARPSVRPSVTPSALRPPIPSEAMHKQVLLPRSVGRSVGRAWSWDSTLQIGMREEFAENCEWPSRITDYAKITMNRPPPRRRLNPMAAETALHAVTVTRPFGEVTLSRSLARSLARSFVRSDFGESSSELSRR